jgi:hypothetical protein
MKNRRRIASEQTNLQGTRDPTAVFEVDLSRRFWIEFGKLRAQIIQTHRVQFLSGFRIRLEQRRKLPATTAREMAMIVPKRLPLTTLEASM